MFRSPVTTLLAAIILLVAAYTIGGSYRTYRNQVWQVETLRTRHNLMTQRQQQFRKQKQIIDSLGGFVDEAARLGLDPDNWETYDVHIQEVVSFSDMKRIINQCVNTSAYYFKPLTLEAKRKIRNPKRILDRPPDAAGEEDNFGPDDGDILLSLRGTFVVKQK